VEVRWRSLCRITSLGKRCTSYNAPPTSRKRAADRWSLRNFLPRSSLFMVGKAQKAHEARYGLYGGCSNGVPPIHFFQTNTDFNSDLSSKKRPSPTLHRVATRSNKERPRNLQTALVCFMYCSVMLLFFSNIWQIQNIWSAVDLLHLYPHWWSPVISSTYGVNLERRILGKILCVVGNSDNPSIITAVSIALL
jgi:hypothetical protein